MTELQADKTVAVGHFWALPRTRLGWITAAVGLVVVIWMALVPQFQDLLSDAGLYRISGGQELVTVALVLGLAGTAMGLHAIVRQKERSGLVVVPVVLMILLTLFWLIFAAAEIISPHGPGDGTTP